MIRWGFIIALATGMATGCSLKRDDMKDAAKIDDLLGVRVLEGKPGLHACLHRPSDQLDYYEAYARFDGDEQSFQALARALSLGARGTPEDGGYLPAPWSSTTGLSLPWWDATPETPPASAARRHGKTGWIRAKFERGHIYLMLSDGSGGPSQ